MLSPLRKSWIVSTACLLLIVPWASFFGVMFTFSFRSGESAWAWIFDLVTFWDQILAAGFSFVRPRVAAFWMLANIVLSAAIGIGFLVQSWSAPGASHRAPLGQIQSAFGTALFFWGIPMIGLLILLIAADRRT